MSHVPGGPLDIGRGDRFTTKMRLYGLLDHEWGTIDEWYLGRESAEAELANILGDEPQWRRRFEIVIADFSGENVTVTPVPRRHRTPRGTERW